MSAQFDHLLPEPVDVADDGYAAVRRHARQQLMTHGFPDLRTEQWKYTSLRALEKREFGTQVGAASALPRRSFDSIDLHFDNGRLITPAASLPAGLTLTPLPAEQLAVTDDGGRAEAFSWLNTASCDQAWCLHIDGTHAKPIRIVISTADDFSVAAHPRLHVALAPGASVTLVEDHDDHGQGLINAVLTLAVAEGAALQHVIHRACHESIWIQRCDIDVAKDGQYQLYAVDLGGRLVRQDHTLNLNQAGANGRLMAVALMNTGQHIDWHTCINHQVGQTLSEEACRMLADGLGVGVFNGRIYIARGADDAHSQMSTANLLLSDQARINTKPELEIYAEEVTASHGATIGQLDDNALFYLRSRGLDAESAAGLLKLGFAATPFDEMPASPLKEWLLAQLREAL